MRLLDILLRTTSVAALALMATGAAAQTPAETGAEAQTTPNDPTATPPQTGDAVDDAAAAEDEIVVTGVRRSLQSAQAIKRNSPGIVDAIVAEDIGKLPDLTVSDTLARIAGVQAPRAQGEAGRVLIRGRADYTTTYNGREIFTSEVRNVSTQDFAAGVVAALEVYKSTTPDQVEGSIAGLINVRSRRPFDFDGLAINGQLNGTFTDQARKKDFNGNLLISNRWDTGIGEIGFLANVAYTRLGYLDSARFNSGDIQRADAVGGAPNAFDFPGAVGIFYARGERERPTANVAFQWRPSENIEIYADGLYQGFQRDVSDRVIDVNLRDRNFSNVVLQDDGIRAQSLTAVVGGPFSFQGATKEVTDTYQGAIGGVVTADRLKVTIDLARTISRFDQSVYSFDFLFNPTSTVDVDFDVDREDGGAEFAFRDLDLTDPALRRFGGLFDRHLVAKSDDVQFRFDVEYDVGAQLLSNIKAGFRFVDRNSAFDLGQDFRGPPDFDPATEGFQATPLTSLTFLDLRLIPRGFRGSDVQGQDRWIAPTSQSIRDNIVDIRRLVGFTDPEGPRPFNLAERFRVNEKSWAGYGQLGYAFEVGGIQVDGVAGVRVVLTDTTPRGEATGSYTDILPTINTRVRFTDELQVRAAYTQTRTRPEFSSLRSDIEEPVQGNEQIIRGGNASLQPFLSDNYDATIEYYFSSSGSASVGVFRRDIAGFIGERETRTTVAVGDPRNPTNGTDNPRPIELVERDPINLPGTIRLEGFEAQLTTFFDFDFVPSWLRSFGIQGNYTLVDDGGVRTRDLSRHAFNIIGLYERGPLSGRLAFNRRSRYFTNADEYTEPVERLDMSVSYTLFENLTIAADVSNILGSPFRNFREYDSASGRTFARDVRFEERVYSLGIRFRL